MGLYGAIVGKAIYTGSLSLADLMRAAGPRKEAKA